MEERDREAQNTKIIRAGTHSLQHGLNINKNVYIRNPHKQTTGDLGVETRQQVE